MIHLLLEWHIGIFPAIVPVFIVAAILVAYGIESMRDSVRY